jgi:O-antigen ligase
VISEQQSVNSERQPSTLTARLLEGSVCALLGWSAWARGGTVVALQGPLPWMGLAILVFLAFDRWGMGKQRSDVRGQKSDDSEPSPTSDIRPPTSDLRPLTSGILFWSGLAFLALLTVQWWNAGRHPYFHPFDRRWVFTPAPHPGWPWAVDRNDAAEMLHWFFPAWALMLALRYARRPAWLATRVAWFLVINASLLAAFGIAQSLSGTDRIFWVTPLSGHFFASFGYENHAASYFALLFALAAGMLLQRLSVGQRAAGRGQKSEIRGQRSGVSLPCVALAKQGGRDCSLFTVHCSLPTHRRTAIVIAAIGAVLCLIGMALSFSRTGMALAVGLSGAALLVAARLFWPRATISQRVAVVAALIMGMATVFFVVASMGGVPLAFEAGQLVNTNLANELDTRRFMFRSVVQMWSENPWFGVGGWGYRHLLPVYALGDVGRRIGVGYANAHNDAMQFLCEFGIVGFGLMLTATLAFSWPLLRRVRGHLPPGLALVGAGLVAVLFHSLIDLPFRSPGILYAWLAVASVGMEMRCPVVLFSEGCPRRGAQCTAAA